MGWIALGRTENRSCLEAHPSPFRSQSSATEAMQELRLQPSAEFRQRTHPTAKDAENSRLRRSRTGIPKPTGVIDFGIRRSRTRTRKR